jgi:hypothetical protein
MAANQCSSSSTNLIQTSWEVRTDYVEDVEGKCKGFRDSLNAKKFAGACHQYNGWQCGEHGGPNKFRAVFDTGFFCNAGHVESAWYEATKNHYGSINCH